MGFRNLAKCEFCGGETDNPFDCNYCNGNYCSDHRLPPNHNCPNLGSWRGYSESDERNNKKKKAEFGGEDNSGFENKSRDQVKGEVKFYNQRKNYGFIIPEDGGEDVYYKGMGVRIGWLESGKR